VSYEPEDPEFILSQYMGLDAFGGGWVPGGIDGRPRDTAVFLEYVRRGGTDTEVDVPVWLEYAAEEGSPGWMVEVMRIAAELERLTLGGACGDCVGEFLDSVTATTNS
jgi:hypothetical protein